MQATTRLIILSTWFALGASVRGQTAAPIASDSPDLWSLARSNAAVHRFSTLFTAQDVRDRLATEEGLAKALDWCKQTGVTKVYIEEFRDGYQAERATLLRAKDRFRAA